MTVVTTQSAEAAAIVERTVTLEKETGTDIAPRARDTNEAIAREVTGKDLEAVETTEIVMIAIVARETVVARETEATEAKEVTEATEATEIGSAGIATATMIDTKERAEIVITVDRTDVLDAMIATETAAEDVLAGAAAHRENCRPCWTSTASFLSTKEYGSLITGMCHHQDMKTKLSQRSKHSVRIRTLSSWTYGDIFILVLTNDIVFVCNRHLPSTWTTCRVEIRDSSRNGCRAGSTARP